MTHIAVLLAPVSLVVVIVVHPWRLGRRRRLAGLERMRPGAWVVLVLAGFAIWLSQMLGASLSSAWLGVQTGGDPSLHSTGAGVLGAYLAAGLALAGLLRLHPWMAPAIGLRWRWRDPLLGMLALGVAMPLLLLLSIALTWLAGAVAGLAGGSPPDPIAHETLGMIAGTGAAHDAWWWISVAGVTLGAPVFEEVIFRGFVQGGLRCVTRSAWPAVLVTSGVFASVHVGAVQWHALGTLFALSVCFGIAMERSGRIAVPIVMHMLFNALNIFMAIGSG